MLMVSPVEISFRDLLARDPKWRVDVGMPEEADGWIRGRAFERSEDGPFNDLLMRMMRRLRTEDRKTVAASFALRFGWAASVAIAPFLIDRCVPDVRLGNISIKFRDTTLFERTAVHEPTGVVLETHALAAHPSVTTVDDETRLLGELRRVLVDHATPVVEALYRWSGFSRRGSWGMIASSWASQFISVSERLGGQAVAKPVVEAFFAGDDDAARMQPLLHPVTEDDVTHLYQRRASCCRYYLLPQGDLCASCPLVSHDERLARNRAWMRELLARQQGRHATT